MIAKHKASAPISTVFPRLATKRSAKPSEAGTKDGAVVLSATNQVEQQRRAFAALVKRIGRDFGVKVDNSVISGAQKNPYRLPAEKMTKIMRRVGILTKTGKLALRFR